MKREDKGTEQIEWETQDESKRKNLDTERARAIAENVDAVVGMVVERGDREAIQETLKATLEEARKRKSEKEVVGLAMALGSLQQLGLGSREREEAGARGAIGDIKGLYRIARRTPTKSQEVELLSVGAQALPKHEGLLREEIEEEIRTGCEEILRTGVPEDERIQLSGAVYAVNAELGLRILRSGHKADKSAIRVETALTRIRTRNGIEKLREMLLEGEVVPKSEEGEEDDEEKLARMLEHGIVALGERSGRQAKRLLDQIADTGARVRLQVAWVGRNWKNKRAVELALEAVEGAVEDKAFVADGSFFREVSLALRSDGSAEAKERLARKLTAQKGSWIAGQPKMAATAVGLELSRYALRKGRITEGIRLLEEAYLEFVEKETDTTTRVECAAVVLAELENWDGEKAEAKRIGIVEETEKALEQGVEAVWTDGADQYSILEKTIEALARRRPRDALRIAEKMNTAERRERAKYAIVVERTDEGPGKTDWRETLRIVNAMERGQLREQAITKLCRQVSREPREQTEEEQEEKMRAITELASRAEEAKGEALTWLLATQPKGGKSEKLAKELRELCEAIEDERERRWTICRMLRIVGRRNDEWGRELVEQLNKAEDQKGWDDRREHGYYLLVWLAIQCIGGLRRVDVDGKEEIEEIERSIDKIRDKVRRTKLLAGLAFELLRTGAEDRGRRIVQGKVWRELEALQAQSLENNASLWGQVYPTIWLANRSRAKTKLRTLSLEVRERAREGIWWVLSTGQAVGDPYRKGPKTQKQLSVEDYHELLELAEEAETDELVYRIYQTIGDSGALRESKGLLTSAKRLDLVGEMKRVAVERLPMDRGIQHNGYLILCLAEAVRVEKGNQQKWKQLIMQARSVSNRADRAFVLLHLGAGCRGTTKLNALGLVTKQEALRTIADLDIIEDRFDRYFMGANLYRGDDPATCLECLRGALRALAGEESRTAKAKRQHLLELVYRINPSWVKEIGLLYDDDPAREEVRNEVRRELDQLEQDKTLHDEIQTKAKMRDVRVKDLANNCWQTLGELYAGRGLPAHRDAIRAVLTRAGSGHVEETYPIFAWAIANLTRRVGPPGHNQGPLKATWDGIRLGLEVHERVCGLRQHIQGRESWRINPEDRASIHIAVGERERGMEYIEKWLVRVNPEHLIVADPYFGPEDVDLLHKVVMANRACQIHILTGPKGHGTLELEPILTAYENEWCMRYDVGVPAAQITIVKKEGTSDSPLHGRYLLTENEGLELGTGWRSLGIKEGRLTRLADYPLDETRQVLQPYLNSRKIEAGGDRVTYQNGWLG